MIKHSELIKYLRNSSIDGKALPNSLIQYVANLTTNGVSPAVLMQATDTSAYSGESAAMAPAIHGCDSGFKLGAASRKEMIGVDPRMCKVIELAICRTTQDFCVYDGLRTMKEQALHVKNGTSRTMQSKHLQGLAADLVPWVNGKPVWDWDRIYPIMRAVDSAATELGLAHLIRWGGAWDRTLSDFGGSVAAYQQECLAYANRHPGKDFLDGAHIELIQ